MLADYTEYEYTVRIHAGKQQVEVFISGANGEVGQPITGDVKGNEWAVSVGAALAREVRKRIPRKPRLVQRAAH